MTYILDSGKNGLCLIETETVVEQEKDDQK
jgi:hypothetical protein